MVTPMSSLICLILELSLSGSLTRLYYGLLDIFGEFFNIPVHGNPLYLSSFTTPTPYKGSPPVPVVLLHDRGPSLLLHLRLFLSACNFYGFKFRLLTKSQFPWSLISRVIKAPHLLSPFISLLRTHIRRQGEQDGLWITTNSTR